MSSGPQDPYTIPGTNVLINKLGLRSFGVLRQAEYDLSRARVKELLLQPIDGRLDFKHLQDVHRHVFQDVYEWAGRLRTVSISKAGHSFVPAELLRSVGTMVFSRLAADRHLRGLEKPQFVEGLAVHYSAINALHPFREGNGRATQVFVSDLARHAGYVVDYTKVGRDQWNEAARLSFRGDLSPMREVFRGLVSPARAVAFDRLPRDVALKRHPELLPAFQRLDDLGRSLANLDSGRRAEVEGLARKAVSRALHDGAIVGWDAGARRSEPPHGLER